MPELKMIPSELLDRRIEAPEIVSGGISGEEGASTRESGILAGYGDFLTLKDVSNVLGVCYKTAMVWAKKGQIPSVKIGGKVYIPKARLVCMAEYGDFGEDSPDGSMKGR